MGEAEGALTGRGCGGIGRSGQRARLCTHSQVGIVGKAVRAFAGRGSGRGCVSIIRLGLCGH